MSFINEETDMMSSCPNQTRGTDDEEDHRPRQQQQPTPPNNVKRNGPYRGQDTGEQNLSEEPYTATASLSLSSNTNNERSPASSSNNRNFSRSTYEEDNSEGSTREAEEKSSSFDPAGFLAATPSTIRDADMVLKVLNEMYPGIQQHVNCSSSDGAAERTEECSSSFSPNSADINSGAGRGDNQQQPFSIGCFVDDLVPPARESHQSPRAASNSTSSTRSLHPHGPLPLGATSLIHQHRQSSTTPLMQQGSLLSVDNNTSSTTPSRNTRRLPRSESLLSSGDRGCSPLTTSSFTVGRPSIISERSFTASPTTSVLQQDTNRSSEERNGTNLLRLNPPGHGRPCRYIRHLGQEGGRSRATSVVSSSSLSISPSVLPLSPEREVAMSSAFGLEEGFYFCSPPRSMNASAVAATTDTNDNDADASPPCPLNEWSTSTDGDGGNILSRPSRSVSPSALGPATTPARQVHFDGPLPIARLETSQFQSFGDMSEVGSIASSSAASSSYNSNRQHVILSDATPGQLSRPKVVR